MRVRLIGADLLKTKLKLMIWILSGVMMKVSIVFFQRYLEVVYVLDEIFVR